MRKIFLHKFWKEAHRLADERHKQKKNFKSCNILSPNYELVGILGEYVYSKITNQELDKRLLINGDSGYDFPNVNIKTSGLAMCRADVRRHGHHSLCCTPFSFFRALG